MRLLPYFQETKVLPYSGQETAFRLKKATRPLEKGAEFPDPVEKAFLFNGWVKENRFRISRKVKHPENFLPLMSGRIESTSTGSILFVRYHLFFSSAMFLIFWTVISTLLFLFFLIFYQEYTYAGIALASGIFNFYIATKNFHLQIRASGKALNEALMIGE